MDNFAIAAVGLAAPLLMLCLSEFRMRRAMRIWPGPEDVKRGVPYALLLHGVVNEVPASIFDAPDTAEPRWHFTTRPRRSPWSILNLRRKPELLMLDREEREVLRIRRRRRIPPCFDLIEKGQHVGTIRLRSVLRNRYTLTMNGGPTWTFRMPLFTVLFYGESSIGTRLWVLMAHKTEWHLLIQAQADD